MTAVATTPEGGLHTVLLNETDITDLVGSRVYLNKAPQKNERRTHIVFDRSSTDNNLTLDGTGGLIFLDFNVDCKSLSPAESLALAERVKDVLKDYTGTWGTGHRCDAVLLGGQDGDFEGFDDGSDEGMYVQTLSFQFQLTEL